MSTAWKPVGYWFAIFAFTSVAYQQVQDHIRPDYAGNNPTVQYLLGVAPNFFPSVGIPSLFLLLIVEVRGKNRSYTWLNSGKHITANALSLFGLLSWEFLQTITARGRFDWHDVLWTLIGAALFQVIWMCTPDRYRPQ